MKQIFTIIALTLITSLITAQTTQPADEGRDVKNVRFGLQIDPSINWYKPDGNVMSKNGVAPKIGGGVVIEFRLAKVASILTGIGVETDGGKIQYKGNGINSNNTNTVSYYMSNTDQTVDEYNSRPNGAADALYFDQHNTKYQLNEREFKATYISVPFGLKLKTKQIGLMTYFGKVGINNSFRWKAKSTDNVTQLPTLAGAGGSSDTKSNVNITNEMNIYVGSIFIGGGCEVNLSGTTSLLLSLHYNLGFTSVTKTSSPSLEKQTNGPNFTTNNLDYSQEQMPQTIKSNSVVLTIGILF